MVSVIPEVSVPSEVIVNNLAIIVAVVGIITLDTAAAMSPNPRPSISIGMSRVNRSHAERAAAVVDAADQTAQWSTADPG